MAIARTSFYSEIKLSEKNQVPNQVQYLKVGSYSHPKYGKFEITPLILSEMVDNFNNRVRKIDIAFDYYHNSDEDAAGWVRSFELRENGTELWATVDWTPKAEKKLSDREVRYFSPDFAFTWEDEFGKEHKNVINGGGLTNRPFIKEMRAIVASEKEGETMTELEKAQARVKELEAQNLKLSEDMAGVKKEMEEMPKPDKVAELEAKIAALQAELAKAKGESEAALAEKKKLEEEKMLAEKENKFNILLSEGKACAAQKDAFIKGDMNEFIKLAEPVNLKPAGHSNVSLPDNDVQQIIKLAEEKMKADGKLSKGDAISLAKKELKK